MVLNHILLQSVVPTIYHNRNPVPKSCDKTCVRSSHFGFDVIIGSTLGYGGLLAGLALDLT
jgi:hypothetical protein